VAVDSFLVLVSERGRVRGSLKFTSGFELFLAVGKGSVVKVMQFSGLLSLELCPLSFSTCFFFRRQFHDGQKCLGKEKFADQIENLGGRALGRREVVLIVNKGCSCNGPKVKVGSRFGCLLTSRRKLRLRKDGNIQANEGIKKGSQCPKTDHIGAEMGARSSPNGIPNPENGHQSRGKTAQP
jgi:hypothetical protein